MHTAPLALAAAAPLATLSPAAEPEKKKDLKAGRETVLTKAPGNSAATIPEFCRH